MRDYHVPRYRFQLIEAIKQVYPSMKLSGMRKRQLYAILFAIRKRR